MRAELMKISHTMTHHSSFQLRHLSHVTFHDTVLGRQCISKSLILFSGFWPPTCRVQHSLGRNRMTWFLHLGQGQQCRPPKVSMAAVGMRFVCIIMYIFASSSKQCPVNVNDSVIIRHSLNLRGKGVANVSAKW